MLCSVTARCDWRAKFDFGSRFVVVDVVSSVWVGMGGGGGVSISKPHPPTPLT